MNQHYLVLREQLMYKIIYLTGDDSKVDTPLPIPNREVKHFNGENSESEDSKLPVFFFVKIKIMLIFNHINIIFLFYY